MKRARILVADDHSMILKGIKGLLEDQYEIVGVADNGKALLDAAERLKPDVVILDISMPILNGIDATREIRKTLPRTKVVVQTMHSNAVYLRKALDAGASAYVLKTGAAEELLTAVETALKGQLYVPAALNQDAIEAMVRRGNRLPRSPAELTDRQRQILQLVAEGKQNKEIAEILHVSVRTVEFHRSRLMGKTGATSVAELTRFAIQEGLVPGPDRV
ncbi:MAG TPA: response regulator transcription factor [Nitrospira sp.]|nr:response regulator transcription factor [Nitrospira sp.]